MVGFLPVRLQFLAVQWCSGAFGLAPPGLVCGRADWSPSFATRASRVSTSFLTRCTSHSDSTPLPRCRIPVPILPSAPVLASRSDFCDDQSNTSQDPDLVLSGSTSDLTFRTKCCHPAAARSVPYTLLLSKQQRPMSCECEGFTYVSISASVCKNARFASSTMSRRLPIFVRVLALFIK